MPLPPAVNFHLFAPCNLRCRFCYATFRDVPGQLDRGGVLNVVRLLRAAGVEKLNLAGGEPTLYPHIAEVLECARELGFVVSIVSNGARLQPLLAGGCLDWVGLSVDSGREDVQAALGRGLGGHVARTKRLAGAVRARGIRLKINTVVTTLNWQEDMSGLIRDLRPERWKVFQVRAVSGQNDGEVDGLIVTADQFDQFVERHSDLDCESLAPIAEDNDAMLGSYAMIDPLGRFFAATGGGHHYSQPIPRVGVEQAFAEVVFDEALFEARGGRYRW